MLEAVGCQSGPIECGADNLFADAGEFCGAGRGCLNFEIINWSICVDVAKWQCFRECDEGEVLNPLRYCQCIPESQQYDMFCAPEPEYECPEVTYPEPIESIEFTDADDELCRQNAGFAL